MQKFPDPTKALGDSIWQSFYTQTENLKTLTNSSSTVLSSNAVSILEALSLLSRVSSTPSYLLYQLKKVYAAKADAYGKIVTSLSDYIGELDAPINQTIDGNKYSLLGCLKQFDNRYTQRRQDRCEKIDFKQTIKSIRLHINTVAFIADIAVDGTFADQVYEALTIIALISNLLLLSIHGANANMASILHSETTDISPTLQNCLETLDPITKDMTVAISSASYVNVRGLEEFLENFVKLVNRYDPLLDDIVGQFEGGNVSVAEVNRNLKKSN